MKMKVKMKTFPRFPRKTKTRLNINLDKIKILVFNPLRHFADFMRT